MAGPGYAFDFVKHWLFAQTRHGTHSPFVYRLLDEVIYADRQVTVHTPISFSSSKIDRLVQRILHHHRARQVVVYDFARPIALESAAVLILQQLPKGEPLQQLEPFLATVQPDTLLIVPEIYRNKLLKMCWEIIKAHPRVTVSIDLFHLGLVYFHPGQAKENFKIRL